MSENERLGIELYVIPPTGDTGTSFLKTLQESIYKISKALSAVDLSSLSKGVEKTASSGKKGVDDFAKSISSLNSELSKTSRSSFKMDGLTEAAKAVASINTSTTSAIAAGLKLASTWEEFRKINAAVAKEMAGGVNSKASQILGAAWQNTKDPVTGVPDAAKLEVVNKLLGKIGDSAGKSAVEVKTLLKDLKEMKLNDTVLIGIRKMEQPQDAHVVAKDKFSAGVASETALASLSRQKELQAQILSESKKEAELRAAYRQAEKQGVADSVKNYQMELGFATQRKEKLIEEARVLAAKVKDEKQAWQDRLVGEKAVEQAVAARTKAEIKANADVQASAERANTARMQVYADSRRNVQAESRASALMANPSTASPQLGVAINAVSLAKEAGDVDKLKTAYGLLRAEVANTNAVASANPWKNIFAGMEVGKTTLEQLTAKVREYKAQYGSIDDKALSSMSTALGHHKAKWDAATQSVVSNKKEVSAWTKLFGESIGQMAARLTEFYSLRTVIFAVGSQFRKAISGAIDFNQNIRDIAAIAGSSRSEMEGLGTSILKIAKDSRFSANEVSGLMQVLAQAGIKARDLGEVSSVVGQFATATASKPEVAADVFTTSLTVFKKEASESTVIANALTAALNNSKLTTEGLATAFNYLAPQAAQFGMTMEQTLGVVAGMSQAGVKASTIGTGTSQLLKELAVPKERLRTLLDYYSIKTDEVNPKLHTFAEIVETLNSAVGRSGEKGVQAEHLFAALESRVGRSMVTAVTLGADTFTNMTNSITGTNAATVAFEKTMEGPRAKINVLNQEVLAFAVSVGTTLGPALAGVTEFATSAVRGLSTVPGALIEMGAGIGVLTVAIRALTLAAKANPVIAGVTVGLLGITAALAYFGRETDETIIRVKEQQKAYTAMAESTQRVKDVTSSAIIEAERNNKGLKEYTELLKGNASQVDEANKLGGTYVNLKAETKKSLYSLKDAHKDWFANIDLEKLKLADLHGILKLVNAERAKGTQASVESYNEVQRKINELEPVVKADTEKVTAYKKPGQARRSLTEYAENDWMESTVNPNSIGRRQKKLSTLQDTKQKSFATMDAEVLTTQYKKNTEGLFVLKTPEEIAADEKAKIELAKQVKANKPIPKSTSAGAAKETSALSYAQNIITQAEKDQAAKRKKDAELILDDTKATMETRKAAWLIVEKSIQEETSKGEKAELDKLGQEFAKDFKGVKYDNKTGVLSGIEAYAEANKQYNLAKTAIKDKWDQQWLTMSSESYKKLSDAERKLLEDFEKESQKIREDEAKRTAELKKKELEDKFKISTDAESTMEAYYAYLAAAEEKISIEYAEKRKKLAKEFWSWSPAMQDAKGAEVLANFNSLDNAEADTKGKVKQEVGTALSTSTTSKVSKEEKQAGYDLANATASLNLEKQRAGTAEQVEQIEVKIQDANIAQTKALLKTYQYAEEIADKKAKAAPLDKEAADAAAEASQQVQAINDKLKEQLLLKTKMEDTSFFGNLGEGARKAMVSFGSFKSMTEELGNTLTNTMLNGAVSSISSAVTTMFNPDQAKIAELNSQISELRTQKSTLESDIKTMSANSSLTPEELKNLNDKKVALDGVNASLAKQEAAVRKQKDGWASFADGMKNVMQIILQELQNYIIKLFVVFAAEQMVKGIKSMFSGGGEVTTPTASKEYKFKDGGRVQKFDSGGLALSGGAIPTNIGIPGKDSVHAMLMPGEVVIKKSSVDYYGADKLLALNDQKIAKFASGGVVGGSSKTGSDRPEGDNKAFTLQIVNVANPDNVPKQPVDAQQVINVISYSAAQKGDVYKIIKGVISS